MKQASASPRWGVFSVPEGSDGTVVQTLHDSTQSLDPYALWHVETHPRATSIVPIAIEFVQDSHWEDHALLRSLIPACYHGQPYATARVRQTQLVELLGSAYNAYIVRIRLGRAWKAPEMFGMSAPDPSSMPHRLEGPVIAVIDDGCAFAHERFRRLDAKGHWCTRIEHLWDQGRSPSKVPARDAWRPVLDFGYGCDLRAADIDSMMAARTDTHGVVDEDAVYRDAMETRTDERALHGTHVLDVAAGRSTDDSDAEQAPKIIFVQLPRDSVRDTSGGWLNTHLLDALWYVHTRVADAAQLVINVSFGAMAGPHDGSSILEQAMDAFCDLRPRNFALVLPAGNAHGSDCHAVLELPPDTSGTVPWRISADDGTDSFIELYYDKSAQLEATLVPPALPASDALRIDQAQVYRDDSGNAQCAMVHLGATTAERDARLFVMLAPCNPQDRNIGAAPAGDWSLVLRNQSKEPVTVYAWIERDGRTDGSAATSGAQARFIANCVPDGTLNSIAHGLRPVVVGGCVGTDPLRMASYSGSGPSRAPGGRSGPDVVAISDEWPTFDGVLGAGSRSGDRRRLKGTSVAAPQVARWILEHLVAAPASRTLAQIKTALRDAARLNPIANLPPGSSQAARQAGAGCIDPQARAASQRH